MWNRVFAIALLLAATASAQPFGDGFAGDQSQYLQEPKKPSSEQVALERPEGIAGKKALRLTKAAGVTFVDVPVDENTKYTLTFRGRFDGGEAVEENPHFDIFTRYGSIPPFVPQRELVFLDKDKKRVGGYSSGQPFRNWTEYRDIFYPPPKAAYFRLVIRSGRPEQVVFVDDVKFDKTPDEGAINPNPVIGRYGKYNYSGWIGFADAARIVEATDGRIGFDSKYGSRSMTFPLPGPGTYAFSLKSEENGFNYAALMDVFDENNKKVGSVSAWGNGKPYKIVVPPEARRASFLIYSSFVEELRVNRVEEGGDHAKP
jgi:hypothetical protein